MSKPQYRCTFRTLTNIYDGVFFAKVVNGLNTIFAKNILDNGHNSEYASASIKYTLPRSRFRNGFDHILKYTNQKFDVTSKIDGD